jgi:hypothetical protein
VVGDGLGRALVSCYCGVHSSLADEATRPEGELRPVSESDSQARGLRYATALVKHFRKLFPQICKRQGDAILMDKVPPPATMSVARRERNFRA